MAYGTVKVDNVTFTYNSADATTTFSGFYASTTNNLTLSGTASAATFTGTTANFTNTNALNISVTTLLSGLAITGGTAGFTIVTGTTVTGTTANFVTVSGTTVTGTTAQFTSITGGTAGFTTITGTTVTGTTANFVTVSGTTVTGTTASFTSGIFTSLSGTTHTITSGVFALGTAALPSISFVSDPNTGIYSPGADQVAVATNGTQRLTVDTAATTSTLPVVHPLGAVGTPSITFTGDLNTGIWSPAADTVAASTAGSERLRITSAGLVGIGTTSPAVLLDVVGASNQLRVSTGAANSFYGFDTAVDSCVWKDFTDGSDYVSLHNNNSIRFGVASSERARIDSSGRLLVGTSTSVGGEIIQSHSTGGDNLGVGRFAASGGSADIVFYKSRSGTVGTNTIVSSSDSLGFLQWKGADGTGYIRAAGIEAFVDGTPGTNDMPGRLVFSTTADGASSPTERMRINSGGDVLIGQTTNPATSRVVVQVQTGTANGVNAQITSNTGTSFPWGNYNASGTYVGGMSCTSTATSFPTSSDYRLKTNVQPLAGAISLVSQLKPSTFEFNENLGETVQGFIAHELQEVVSLAVIGEKDAEDANGNPIYQGVDAAKLVPLLTAALQEAVAEIKALKDRVTALETA